MHGALKVELTIYLNEYGKERLPSNHILMKETYPHQSRRDRLERSLNRKLLILPGWSKAVRA